MPVHGIRACTRGERVSKTRVWDKVRKTNPEFVKRVNQRGGFTAIDAYYKIHKATKQFGPVGEGWGWDEPEQLIGDGVFLVKVCLWWRDDPAPDAKRNEFWVYGAAQWVRKNGVDTDAPKKALTDAITKGLSYLGVCADVFLGKFDDSKYVESLWAELRAAREGK